MGTKKLITAILWVGWTGALFAKGKAPSVMEIAPLQGSVGQLSVRAERGLSGNYSMGMAYENLNRISERDEKRDSSHRISGEVLAYPQVLDLPGLFVGAGITYERAEIYRRRDRDYQTGIDYSESDRFDLWRNEDQYLSATGSVGYRANWGKYVTGSLRLTQDLLFYTHSESRPEKVYSRSPDLSTNGRDKNITKIGFFVGVTFD